MIKILMLLLLGFVGYSVIQGILNPKNKRDRKMPGKSSRDGEQMVEDPQCGTFIPLSDAFSTTIHGRQQHFCSKKCLKEYKKAHK